MRDQTKIFLAFADLGSVPVHQHYDDESPSPAIPTSRSRSDGRYARQDDVSFEGSSTAFVVTPAEISYSLMLRTAIPPREDKESMSFNYGPPYARDGRTLVVPRKWNWQAWFCRG